MVVIKMENFKTEKRKTKSTSEKAILLPRIHENLPFVVNYHMYYIYV